MSDPGEIGKRFQNEMRKRRLRVRWLAAKSGVSAKTIDRVKNGIGVKRVTLIALAEALDVDPAWLIDGAGTAPDVSPPPPPALRTPRTDKRAEPAARERSAGSVASALAEARAAALAELAASPRENMPFWAAMLTEIVALEERLQGRSAP